VVLGSVDTPMADIWRVYEDLTGQSKDTLAYLVGEYLKSDKLAERKTHREIERNLKTILSAPVGGREFGMVKYSSITVGTIQRYLDYRNNVAGNREVAALSAAWNWCLRRDIVTTPNPCSGAEKVKEHHRTRYVTDSEYGAVYNLAPDYIKVAMELAYLCRMRRIEVLDVRCKDVEEGGLNTRRVKGSDDALTLWSPRLKAAVDLGLKGKIRVPDMLVVTYRNTTIRGDTFSKRFHALVSESGVESFTFHDLKAKGVSDFDGDKKAASGHRSEAMVSIYDRKRKSVDATD
jgi:integrase